MSSYIFQMHQVALEEIDGWWNSEDLPSLENSLRNSTRVVCLRGLTPKEALVLTERYLEDVRVDSAAAPTRVHPFSEEIIEAVCDSVKGNPRDLLRKLGEILDHAQASQLRHIDLADVEPFLTDDFEMVEEEDDDLANPIR
jgi:replication-associated recombination protein RarA